MLKTSKMDFIAGQEKLLLHTWLFYYYLPSHLKIEICTIRAHKIKRKNGYPELQINKDFHDDPIN